MAMSIVLIPVEEQTELLRNMILVANQHGFLAMSGCQTPHTLCGVDAQAHIELGCTAKSNATRLDFTCATLGWKRVATSLRDYIIAPFTKES